MSFEDFCLNFRNIYSCKLVGDQKMTSISGEWSKSNGTAAGCQTYNSFNNPQYLISVTNNCEITIVLSQNEKVSTTAGQFEDPNAMGIIAYNFSSIDSSGTKKRKIKFMHRDVIRESKYAYNRDMSLSLEMKSNSGNSNSNNVVILPTMFNEGHENKFEIRVYASVGNATIVELKD